jgi:pseudaminic acid synthase
MNGVLTVGGRSVWPGYPAYIIAEVSANHNQSYDRALAIVEAAKDAGADAVKLQTYTADTMTLDCATEWFQLKGTLWDGRTLHSLYQEAYTPWEWHAPLKARANELGMDLFSSPFDATAVDFLEELGVPVHKIASFENTDLPLLRKVARTGKPIIMSTGMATLEEIEEAVQTIADAGGSQLALLKCTSAYPAPARDMNLRTIPDLARRFGVPVGLSDHTLDLAVPVAAVGLGACIIEKHFTISRSEPGPDSAFSLEPAEFRAMVDAVRTAEQALGAVHYGGGAGEDSLRAYRRSIFVSADVRSGERITEDHVRVIRPAHGLHTRHLDEVIGRRAARDIPRGTPLSWDMLQEQDA